MLLHVHTQYRENYGTPESPYWKFKGGDTFVVTGFAHPLTSGIGDAAERAVLSVLPRIEYRNDMSEQYMLDWELVLDDSAQTEDERLQMEFDGRVSYPSPRLSLH